MSQTKLNKLIDEKHNPSVIGLDPMLNYIPDDIIKKSIKEHGKNSIAVGDAIFNYNKAIIDSVCDIVACIKPQSAFYELYGIEGEKALKKTIDYAHQNNMYVILDVKRGDIGSTAVAYSSAYLGSTEIFDDTIFSYNCDAITVNPYLGSDGIIPFIKDCIKYNKMIFTLVKTSNPSSGELQDLYISNVNGNKSTVYKYIASLVKIWGESTIKNSYSSVGAVVGATYPEQLKELRTFMPNTIFLIPGYGAQGGKASDIACAFDSEGHGAIVNSSRGIILAHKKFNGDPKIAWRNAAITMKNDLNKYIKW